MSYCTRLADVDLPQSVVAVLCSKDYPDLNQVVEAIKTGPEATWVCRAKDPVAISAFAAAGIEPVLLELNPFWKSAARDDRSLMRDAEIRTYCSHVLVFAGPGTKSLNHWRPKHAGEMAFLNPKNVYVIEPKRRRR